MAWELTVHGRPNDRLAVDIYLGAFSADFDFMHVNKSSTGLAPDFKEALALEKNCLTAGKSLHLSHPRERVKINSMRRRNPLGEAIQITMLGRRRVQSLHRKWWLWLPLYNSLIVMFSSPKGVIRFHLCLTDCFSRSKGDLLLKEILSIQLLLIILLSALIRIGAGFAGRHIEKMGVRILGTGWMKILQLTHLTMRMNLDKW